MKSSSRGHDALIRDQSVVTSAYRSLLRRQTAAVKAPAKVARLRVGELDCATDVSDRRTISPGREIGRNLDGVVIARRTDERKLRLAAADRAIADRRPRADGERSRGAGSLPRRIVDDDII